MITTTTYADSPARQTKEINKLIKFQFCAPFIDCKSVILNAQVDNANNLVVVTPMYNLIKHSDNHAKTGGLSQCNKSDSNDNITDSESFNFKARITGRPPAAGSTKDLEINVLLKYLSNSCRTFETFKFSY